MKKFFTMLMAVCFMVILLPITVSASVSDSDLYNAGDVAVIQKIIEASPTLSEKYDKNNPASWDSSFVGWSHDGAENRVVALNLCYVEADGNLIDVIDFGGTMDVSGLDFLSYLKCSNNPGLTKLILPESGSLTSLHCFATGITELDLSAQTNLTNLECYSCEDLAALDVSQNTNLEALHCHGTAITSLNLSNNPVLTYLNCSNTGITTLDLSANTSLVEINLPTCSEIIMPEGHKITMQQTTGGTLSLSVVNDGSSKVYTLTAYCDPDYRLVRFIGVTNKISEDGTSVSFTATGNMTLSAEFAIDERLLLTALAIDGVELSPVFSSTVYQYTASVGHNVDQINIRAQGADGYELNIKGEGIHPLKEGANTFVVTVIVPIVPGLSDINNPNETLTTNYTITVTREESSEDTTESTPEDTQEDTSESTSESTPTQESAAALELDDVPKTGEDSHTGLCFVLMLIGIVTLKAGATMWRQNKQSL